MAIAGIPHFQLYGEGASYADPGFVHIETIESRSRLTDWEIGPHRHETLNQLSLVRHGSALATIEGMEETGHGSFLIHVPAGAIHGFKFDEDVDGVVITFSVDLFAMLSGGQAGLGMLPARPIVQSLPRPEIEQLWPLVEALQFECSGHADGRIHAAAWLVGVLLMRVARVVQDEANPSSNRGERLQRFRVLVEEHFREHRPVAFYAQALGMTERTLARLTAARFGCSPIQFIHRRLLLEARRLLVYSNQPAVSIAEELGFSDPSYFSRFYLRMTGDRPSFARAKATRSA